MVLEIKPTAEGIETEVLRPGLFISKPTLSFIKTSYTRNINDLAPSSIGKVPVRFWHDHVAPALPRLASQCLLCPRGSHPGKPRPASATPRSAQPTTLPATHGMAQAVLGRGAKSLDKMERTSHPGDTQKRC